MAVRKTSEKRTSAKLAAIALPALALLAAAVMTGTASLARAQVETERCLNAPSESRDWRDCITTCTGLIQTGRYRGSVLSRLHSSRGACHRRLRQMEPALSDLDRALALDPENWGAYLSRSAVYGEQKRWDPAIADATRAIELDPRNALGYVNRCVSYHRSGRSKEALPDCRAAIRLEPDHPVARRLLGEMCAGGQSGAC
jgi:tetratricopeptide (TPR) repeat protein